MIPLKGFQQQAIEHGVSVINDLLNDLSHIRDVEQRQQLINHKGCLLIEAPTGAGKTLISGHIADRLCAQHRIVWFWFSPFTNLLNQTEGVIQEEFRRLRVRNIHLDRDVSYIVGGDIFVTTWQSVAAKNLTSRKIRTAGESTISLDQMINTVKAMGYSIGVIIDEAHHGFVKAPEAINFYKRVLSPDATILITATPRDKDVKSFQKATGIAHVSRNVISRQECVDSGLVKKGVKVITFTPRASGDEVLVDFELTAIRHAKAVHDNIASSLSDRGINLTPLLLIQVGSDPDSVERARNHLISLNFHPDSIAIHTADEPDPHLVALANDETKQVLIFKMAVAMGFDAPRAFTLVSMRSSRDEAFGLQLVGRILRVHRQLQGIELPEYLKYGYVFLADRTMQTGLVNAAQRINQLRSELAEINTEIGVFVINEEEDGRVQVFPGGQITLPIESAITNQTASLLIESSNVNQTTSISVVANSNSNSSIIVRDSNTHEIGNIQVGYDGLGNSIDIISNDRENSSYMGNEEIQEIQPVCTNEIQSREYQNETINGEQLNVLDLLGFSTEGILKEEDVQKSSSHRSKQIETGAITYRLRTDIQYPRVFHREVLYMDDTEALINCIVNNFPFNEKIVMQSQKVGIEVIRREVDIFDENTTINKTADAADLSARTIALQAQQVMFEDEYISMRDIHPHLVERLRTEYLRYGLLNNTSQERLEHGLNLIIAQNKDLLKRVKRQCLRRFVRSIESSDIPQMIALLNPVPSSLNLYRVFPDVNGDEKAFAEYIDNDVTGIVQWWHRNEDRKIYSASVALDNGNYYPDFIIGVKGRDSLDQVILVEVKGEHLFQNENSIQKAGASHCSYGNVMMVTNSDGQWHIVESSGNRNFLSKPFLIEDLITY